MTPPGSTKKSRWDNMAKNDNTHALRFYNSLAQLDGDGTGMQDMHNLLPDALHASQMHIRGKKILNIYYVLSQTLAMLALTAVMIMEILKI